MMFHKNCCQINLFFFQNLVGILKYLNKNLSFFRWHGRWNGFRLQTKHMEVVARIARKSLASFWPYSFETLNKQWLKNLLNNVKILKTTIHNQVLQYSLSKKTATLCFWSELYENRIMWMLCEKWTEEAEFSQTLISTDWHIDKAGVCWDCKRLIHYKILQSHQEIDFHLVCLQLKRLIYCDSSPNQKFI